MVAPVIGAALLGAAGGLASNLLNIKQADKQMNFQSDMSSTAYRRAVVDMKAAGINPMLAYMKGGASTPSGAQAVMKNIMENAVTTAIQYRRAEEEIKNIREQNRLLQAQTAKTNKEANILGYKETKSGIYDDLLNYLKDLVEPEVKASGKVIKKHKPMTIEIQK